MGCGGLRGGEEFQFDGDGGAGFAGHGVEDVAGYEGAGLLLLLRHGWSAGSEGCFWRMEVGCDLCDSVWCGLCFGCHRLREDCGDGVREREDQSLLYL